MNEFISGDTVMAYTDGKVCYLVSKTEGRKKGNLNVLASSISKHKIYGNCLAVPSRFVSKKIINEK